MSKLKVEETNETYEKLVKLLKDAGVQIVHPITVYTYNLDKKDAWVCCNYSGPGVKVPLSELNYADFDNIDNEIMKHCATWSFIEK